MIYTKRQQKNIMILLFIIVLLISGCVNCNRWHYTNHCDSLCYSEYGRSQINDCHNDSTVIPLDKNYNNYICICDKGNITTSWTCT